jgi:hypothetical protein
MSKTAVGLFENPVVADQVVHDLDASAFPRDEIRVLREPLDLGGSGLMSTPHLDFEVGLERELTAIGATVNEANAYADGVRRGGVLVFATGSNEAVADAGRIMNRRGAMEVETLVGREPNTAILTGDDLPSARESETQTGRIRDASGGARVFIW